MTFNVNPAAVSLSAATEVGIATEMAASSAGTAPAMMSVLPMALDLDSAAFVAAHQAATAAYSGIKAEHVAQRGLYSAMQAGASLATEANEAISAAANTLA